MQLLLQWQSYYNINVLSQHVIHLKLQFHVKYISIKKKKEKKISLARVI